MPDTMSNPKHDRDVLIVGGGIAGLSCALELTKQQISCRIFEASDRIGGRVQTDEVQGFFLDRGFQVFLTAYPEAARVLDYAALELCSFEPGALIHIGGRFHRLSDPWRRPQHLFATALSAAASLSDKLRIGSFRKSTTQPSLSELFHHPETKTLELLRQRGFSEVIIEKFFRPFLGGVFLDRELATSSRMCEFVFRMFSTGSAAIPKAGMKAIPEQLANQLPAETIVCNQSVTDVSGTSLTFSDGNRADGRAIVVATDAPAARRLFDDDYPASGQSVTCLYFAADQAPIKEPILLLNGDPTGPINNLCVPTLLSPNFAPNEKHLISVTVLGEHPDEESLIRDVLHQAHAWFPGEIESWSHLKSYSIPYALPTMNPPALSPVAKAAHRNGPHFICGDHCDTASINGAMASGRRAAEAVQQWISQK